MTEDAGTQMTGSAPSTSVPIGAHRAVEVPTVPDASPSARRPGRGVLLVLVSSTAFGSAGACAKAALTATAGDLSPLRLTEIRITAAALVLLAILAARSFIGRRAAAKRPSPAVVSGAAETDAGHLAGPSSERSAGTWRIRDSRGLVLAVAGYGLLAFAAVQTLYYTAITRMPVGIALLIEYLAPALVALWAVFVQRRPQARATWAGIVLALVGLALIARPWAGFVLDGFGLTAALIAAAALAGYFLIAESIGGRLPALQLTAWAATAGAVALGVIQPWWSFPWHTLGRSARLPGLGNIAVPVWLLLLVVVLIGTVLAYLTGIAALQHLPAPIASVLATVEIVVAAATAWWLLGEQLTLLDVIGGAVLISGALLAGNRSARF